jgi:hypothetical protein
MVFHELPKCMRVRVMSLAFHFQITVTAADMCLSCSSSRYPSRFWLVFTEPDNKMERSAIRVIFPALFQSRETSEHAASLALAEG